MKRRRMFVIEFRSGSLFVNLASDRGVGGEDKYERARKFPTRRAARKFADRHPWIWFNGGMVRRAVPTQAERFCWEFEAQGRTYREAAARGDLLDAMAAVLPRELPELSEDDLARLRSIYSDGRRRDR